MEVLRTWSGGGRIAALTQDCSGVLAVGGGYLVADSVVRSGGVLLNHLSQIIAAGRAQVPSIYLPQSIGPLLGPVGDLARRALAKIDVLYVRDDETLRELGSITDVRRCPDLAVMRLAESLESIQVPRGKQGGPTVLVARELPRAPGYVDNLVRLGKAVASPLWAVQADVDGPRSDRRFLRVLDVPDAGDMSGVLTRHSPGVVVSVRLHGAIAALLAGWPAIHLSYERKGHGAYEDLGIAEYVHDARKFDLDKVRAQVEALHENPLPLFARIQARRPALMAAYRSLVEDVSRRLGGAR
jgi:polysaccharide pyruvyl transferase WcaK-like protein